MHFLKVNNPATEKEIAAIPATEKQQLAAAFAKAKLAQQSWRNEPLAQRIAIVKGFADLLEQQKDQLAADLTAETCKPLQQAYNEIKGALHRINFFVQHAPTVLADEKVYDKNGIQEWISYEPLGVVGNISAWNYPYLVGVNVWIPALLAGNAVLYKPSEYALLTGGHITRLLHEAGVPAAVFFLVNGNGEAGTWMTELGLDGYFFTGSYATGQKIKQALAGRMVPVQLELGGKDPLYVMDDVADVKATAEAVLEGIMYNAGQSCCAVERVYVHESVYETFEAALVAAAKNTPAGDPMDSATQLGPVCRQPQLQLLQAQVNDAKAKGANLLYQTQKLPNRGHYFPLTLLGNVSHQMALMTEESFGPVCGIQKVKDDDEAIRLMLDTPYGLTAAVYGSNAERARKIMQAMHTGTVYFNCCDRVSPYTPWSGRGHSGIGHTLSYHGIRAFTQMKAWHWRQ